MAQNQLLPSQPTVSITPTVLTDGLLYANAVPLTFNEASLGDNLKTPDPIAMVEGQTIIGIVKLTANGHITGSNAFVFLQTDLGDGNWVDVAWCNTRMTDGTATFVLCGGGIGAENNAFGPIRQFGSAPATQANGSNTMPIGGRCRFTGFGLSVGGSSSLAGTFASIQATITYRIQDPR